MDTELVRRGLADTRERARQAVVGGRVLVSGSVATKPARMVDPAEPIEIVGDPEPFVSRGGVKLAGALDAFGIEPAGKRCLDVGSSTGGFTDLLLQRGAEAVVAVDVGTGQLDWKLRTDPRVTVMERTDVRSLEPDELGAFGFVCADLSFISLRTVMPHLAAVAGEADIVVLVKPQFEVGRGRVPRGGVVRDPELHAVAVAGVVEAARSHGLDVVEQTPSPIEGADGNREFFLHLRSGP